MIQVEFCGDGNLTVGPCLKPTGSISLGGASRGVVLLNEGSNRAGRGKFSLRIDGMTMAGWEGVVLTGDETGAVDSGLRSRSRGLSLEMEME